MWRVVHQAKKPFVVIGALVVTLVAGIVSLVQRFRKTPAASVARDEPAESAESTAVGHRTPLEKWHAWVGLFVALLTLFTLLLDLPEKIGELWGGDSADSGMVFHTFEGTIRDEASGDLLAGVTVHVIDAADVQGDSLTNHLGRFSFTFSTAKPFVNLEARKPGYRPLRRQVGLTPPRTDNTFPMVVLAP